MKTVFAPLSGLFSRVEDVGTPVDAGDLLCYVRAGGISKPLTSPCAGIVHAIHPPDNTHVQQADVLYEIDDEHQQGTGNPPV